MCFYIYSYFFHYIYFFFYVRAIKFVLFQKQRLPAEDRIGHDTMMFLRHPGCWAQLK